MQTALNPGLVKSIQVHHIHTFSSGGNTTPGATHIRYARATTKKTLDWTALWTGLNYELTRKMVKLFSIVFLTVSKRYQFM